MVIDLVTRPLRLLAAGTSANRTNQTFSGSSSARASDGAGGDAADRAGEAILPECVDVAVVVGYRADRLGIHEPAERVAALCRTRPDRLIGFAGVDPLSNDLDESLAALKDLGLRGVAVAPADQGCRPTHDRFLHVLAWCGARTVPVLVSNPGLASPQSVLEFARPSLLDEALREMPTLTVILGDVGAAFADEALALATKHESVFIELSSVAGRSMALARLVCDAHERGLAHKLLFASGAPAATAEPNRTSRRPRCLWVMLLSLARASCRWCCPRCC
jgi:predicted TIM-barrel fold metal-dependent hydrolase